MEKPWMNAALSVEERTELLLSAMTVNEKIAQILNMKGYTLYNRHGNTLEISQELIDFYKDQSEKFIVVTECDDYEVIHDFFHYGKKLLKDSGSKQSEETSESQ